MYTVKAGGPVLVWQTSGGTTTTTAGTGKLNGRTRLTVMQKRGPEWWPIGTVILEPGPQKAVATLREFKSPADNDWRSYYGWFGGGKKSGTVEFSGVDITPEVVKENKRDIDEAEKIFNKLVPSPGLLNPLGFCRLAYANWEEPSPTTAFNGISVCGPDCFPEAVQFALEVSPDASIDDLGALACGYFGSTGLYTPDPVDILTPIWASRGRGDCEDFAITAVAMLRCCEPDKYSGKVAEVGRRVKTWNPKMVCGYVEMDTGMTGHAWLGAEIDGELRMIECTEPFRLSPGFPNSIPTERYKSVCFGFDHLGAYAAMGPKGVGVKVGEPVSWKSLAWKTAAPRHVPTGISMKSSMVAVDRTGQP